MADRWHLLHNIRQVAERWLAGTHALLWWLLPLTGTAASRLQRAGAFPRSQDDTVISNESRARRLTFYEEIRQCHAGGEPLLTISRRMGLARGTVRRYALAESFPERALPQLRPSILDPHLAYLDQRLAQGCENALVLWRELRAGGFPGTRRQVSRWLQPRRRAPAPFGPRPASARLDQLACR